MLAFIYFDRNLGGRRAVAKVTVALISALDQRAPLATLATRRCGETSAMHH